MLAFYKVNNRPFIDLLQSAMFFYLNSKLYLWKQQKPKAQKQARRNANEIVKPYVPKVSENKLKDIAWSLDIKESMYTDESQVKQQT